MLLSTWVTSLVTDRVDWRGWCWLGDGEEPVMGGGGAHLAVGPRGSSGAVPVEWWQRAVVAWRAWAGSHERLVLPLPFDPAARTRAWVVRFSGGGLEGVGASAAVGNGTGLGHSLGDGSSRSGRLMLWWRG